MFEGIITALITPFKNGAIDIETLQPLIEKQTQAGIKSIVVGGSTGEGSSLSDEEYYFLIKEAKRIASGRINIIAGMTSVSTIHACEKAKKLNTLADGLMCTLPHYIKPEQHGVEQHFKALDEISKLPIILYLNPGRTGLNLTDQTLTRLASLSNIKALKDASGDMERPLRLSVLRQKGFKFLVGDDSAFLAYSANGGCGCVSVISNVLPSFMTNIHTKCISGQFSQARALMEQAISIINTVGIESNPIGIKYLAHRLGLLSSEIRLPLTVADISAKPIENITELAKKLESHASKT